MVSVGPVIIEGSGTGLIGWPSSGAEELGCMEDLVANLNRRHHPFTLIRLFLVFLVTMKEALMVVR
jgi:hypothetical protein